MGSMARRLFRVAVTVCCLVSLLACVGAGWLWWHRKQGFFDACEVAAGGTFARAQSGVSGLSLFIIRGWRGPAEVRPLSTRDPLGPYRLHDMIPVSVVRERKAFGAVVRSADVVVLPDGYRTPASGNPAPLSPILAAGPVLPAWAVTVPHGWVVTATAIPPLLWVAVRSRRASVLRRRKRLGLCLHCGYDLRGSPDSRRCSECGEAVPVDAKGTAA